MAGGCPEHLRYWLALHRAPRVGGRAGRLLLEFFGDPQAVFSESAATLAEVGLKPETIHWLQNPSWDAVERDLRWLESDGHHCLTLSDPDYPGLLLEIPDPPLMLFVAGKPDTLACRQIAVVGSRNPSPSGEGMARELARALAFAGCGVTSGLAIGIDAAAHRGALEGRGLTLAVAGTGLDQVYPSRHFALAEEIQAAGGALVSEFPLGTPPQASNFPRRNRVISGLAQGTLVVEAALRSGSLITARLALEQGREVFAVPGSVNNPMARGCNQLIKQGAKLVEGVDDILEEFGWRGVIPDDRAAAANRPLDADKCAWLLKYIAYDPTSVDTLVAATGRTPDAILATLLRLELQGHIFSTSGGCYCRVK